MDKKRLAVAVPCCLVALAAVALAQGDWKKALEQSLNKEYQVTKTSRFERNNVTEPGTVFVVQQEGLAADLSSDMTFFTAKVVKGQVSQRGGAAGFFSKDTTRTLKSGDRVYALSIEVRDDCLRVLFLTREMFEIQQKGSTKQTRYKGGVDFEFDKAELAAMDVETAKKSIEAVLIPEAKATAVQTKTVELGQTPEEVEKILGKPEKIAKLGDKMIYTYKDIKVVFMNGKVSDVQ